ncbi:MAG: hypothetical protein K6A43_08065 [Treponema sp.]|nr:hypothetical protein [Treponema sp.]
MGENMNKSNHKTVKEKFETCRYIFFKEDQKVKNQGDLFYVVRPVFSKEDAKKVKKNNSKFKKLIYKKCDICKGYHLYECSFRTIWKLRLLAFSMIFSAFLFSFCLFLLCLDDLIF